MVGDEEGASWIGRSCGRGCAVRREREARTLGLKTVCGEQDWVHLVGKLVSDRLDSHEVTTGFEAHLPSADVEAEELSRLDSAASLLERCRLFDEQYPPDQFKNLGNVIQWLDFQRIDVLTRCPKYIACRRYLVTGAPQN